MASILNEIVERLRSQKNTMGFVSCATTDDRVNLSKQLEQSGFSFKPGKVTDDLMRGEIECDCGGKSGVVLMIRP